MSITPRHSRTPEIRLQSPVHDARGILVRGTTEKAHVGIEFTERIPSVVNNPTGVVIVPGLYGLKPTYSDFRDALAEALQRPVFTYRHDRRERGLHHALHPARLAHPARVGGQSVVAMIDTVTRLTDTDTTTLLGHSKGGPDAADGALHRSQAVSDILFLGSGGLEEGQNTGRLARRLPGVVVREIVPSAYTLAHQNSLRLITHAVGHIATNPWRLAGEALDVSNRPMMHTELTTLKAAGVTLRSVHLEHDGFFPLEHIAPAVPDYMDSSLVMLGANHLAPQNQPEATARFIANHLEPVFAQQTEPMAA